MDNKERKDLQKEIELQISKNQDIEKYIVGYVINRGSVGFDTKSVCYGACPASEPNTSYVLLNSIGGLLHWHIYSNRNVIVSETESKKDGVKLFKQLQQIRNLI